MPDVHFLGLEPDRVVLFADIIGFSNAIIKSEGVNWNEKNVEGIIINLPTIYKILTTGDFSEDYQKRMKIKFLWVSDSIVISCHKNDINNLMITLNELTNQLYCAHFAIRGAITEGPLYHQNNVWGVPLVKAVTYEKEKAKYPRIIMEKCNLENLEFDSRFSKFIFVCEEDPNFVYYDYFGAFFFDQIQQMKDIHSYLAVYIGLITSNYAIATESKHKVTWRWLAQKLYNAIDSNSKYIQNLLESKEIYGAYPVRRLTKVNDYLEMIKPMLND